MIKNVITYTSQRDTCAAFVRAKTSVYHVDHFPDDVPLDRVFNSPLAVAHPRTDKSLMIYVQATGSNRDTKKPGVMEYNWALGTDDYGNNVVVKAFGEDTRKLSDLERNDLVVLENHATGSRHGLLEHLHYMTEATTVESLGKKVTHNQPDTVSIAQDPAAHSPSLVVKHEPKNVDSAVQHQPQSAPSQVSAPSIEGRGPAAQPAAQVQNQATDFSRPNLGRAAHPQQQPQVVQSEQHTDSAPLTFTVPPPPPPPTLPKVEASEPQQTPSTNLAPTSPPAVGMQTPDMSNMERPIPGTPVKVSESDTATPIITIIAPQQD